MGGRRTASSVFLRVYTIPVLLAFLQVGVPGIGLCTEPQGPYSQGKTAVEEEQWDLAARLMMQVIDAEPDEKRRPLYGPYIPNFFLGLSLYELGDCDLAMRYLERSRLYRVVLKTKHLAELEELEGSCRARSEMLRRVRKKIKTGIRLAKKVEARTDDPLLIGFWNQGLPPPAVQLREAQRVLERAERLLETETSLEISGDPVVQVRPLSDDQISRSGQIASQVLDLLQSLEESTEQHALETAVARPELLDDVLELRLQVVRAWSSVSVGAKTSSDSELSTEFQRLTTLHLGDREVTVDELQALKSQLANFLEELDELARSRPRQALTRQHRAPTRLRQAAAAYFAGDYNQVLDLLEGVSFSQRQELAHFHLFRAAALYSLYLVGDQPNSNLLSGAQWNVKSCLDANASLEPLTEAFSPRFVEFFREQSALEAQRQ